MTDDRTENWVILVRFQVIHISHLFILLLSQGLRKFLKNAFCKNVLVPLPLWNLINTLSSVQKAFQHFVFTAASVSLKYN